MASADSRKLPAYFLKPWQSKHRHALLTPATRWRVFIQDQERIETERVSKDRRDGREPITAAHALLRIVALRREAADPLPHRFVSAVLCDAEEALHRHLSHVKIRVLA